MAGRDHRGGRCLRRRDLSGGIFREKRQVKKHKEQTRARRYQRFGNDSPGQQSVVLSVQS